MRWIGDALEKLGHGARVRFDPSITRGLDYYTGIVFETFLDGAESIGSVCSGGRYDDLVSLYSKESLPGVGASIGLDRLISALDELKRGPRLQHAADLLVVVQSDELIVHYHKIAATLRDAGIRCEVFPEDKKLGQQFAFAERKGIPFALICGPEEYEAGTVNLRELETRRSEDGIDLDRVVERVSTHARRDGDGRA